MAINPFTGLEEQDELDPITGLPVVDQQDPMLMVPDMSMPVPPEAQRSPASDSVSSSINPTVRDYLNKKFNLGEYSDDNRKKLITDSQLTGQDRIAAMLAAAGAGFSGRDASAAGMGALKTARDNKRQSLEDFDKGRAGKIQEFALDRDLTKADREDRDDATVQAKLKREMDPMSEESKMAQDLAKSMGYQGDTSKLTAQQFQAFSPALQKKYELAEKSLDRAEQRKDRESDRAFRREESALRREEMNARRDETEARKDEARQDKLNEKAKLSDKQVDAVSSYDKALGSIQSIRSQKDQFDTGPAAGRLNSAAALIGLDDSKKSAFRSEVQDQLAQYIKSISGGAVSDQERASLLQNLPNMNDNDNTFNAKLDALEKRLQRNKDLELSNLQRQGKNVSGFKEAEVPKSAPPVETKTVGGKTYKKVPGGWEEI